MADPVVRFGATPAWVTPYNGSVTAPNLKDVNDGYFLRLYEHQYHADRSEVYVHFIREIVSEEGVQAASNISARFSPAYEHLTFHTITIWRNGIPINKTRSEAFKVMASESELSRFIYNGSYTAYRVLEDVRPGDRIEYAYTLSGDNPVFEGKFFGQFNLQAGDPIAAVHFRLLASKRRTLNLKYFNDVPHAVESVLGDLNVYEWDLKEVPGRKSGDNSPGWFNPYWYVSVSEYRSWDEVAAWGCKLNPVKPVVGDLLVKLSVLKSQYADREQLFRAIVDMVQSDVRYMGIELGEYSHRATDPNTVYDRRYGDCKDKSLLLVSLLQHCGFKACMALVNTSLEDKIGDYPPSPNMFNHAIVMAEVNGKEIWVDPTDSRQGGVGADIYCASYGKALLLQPGTSGLKNMPGLSAGSIRYFEEYDAPEIGKPVQLTVRTIYTRAHADQMRGQIANQSRHDMEKNFLDYYTRIFGHIEATDSVQVTDDRSSNELRVVEHYRLDSFFTYNTGRKYYEADFYSYMIRNVLPTVGNNREFPFAINYPYDIVCSVRLNAPINWQITPRSGELSRDAYSFSYDVNSTGNVLFLRHEFHTFKDHIAPGGIAQYEADRKKLVDDYLAYGVTYTPGVEQAPSQAGPNWLAVLAVLVLIAGLCHAGYRIYHTPTRGIYSGYVSALSIGGWLILPIIAMALSPIRVIYLVASTGYLKSTLWHAFDSSSVAGLYKALLWFELLGNTTIGLLGVFCLVLIFNRRDIAPKFIVISYVVSLVVVLVDAAGAKVIFPTHPVDYSNISRSVVAALIWIPYFTRAARVRDTFVLPYPRPNFYNSAESLGEEESITVNETADVDAEHEEGRK